MASSKEYLDFVLEQLAGAGEITYRAMMGEYVLYLSGKVIGGVYDDRFLLKIAPLVAPVDDPPLLAGIVRAVGEDFPASGKSANKAFD